MDELTAVKTLLDLGGQAILLAMLYVVWREMKELRTEFIQFLIDAQKKNEADNRRIAHAVGVDLPSADGIDYRTPSERS